MNNRKNNRTEKILESLDGVKRAAAPDFFYTRLKARLENELIPQGNKSRVLRPAYAFAALFLVLLVNAAVVITKKNSDDGNIANNDNELQSIASEYNQNDVNSFYDLTQEK